MQQFHEFSKGRNCGDEITIGGRLGGVKITTIWSRGRRAKQRCSFTNFLKGVTAETKTISQK